MARTSIEHLSEGMRKRLTLVGCILGSAIVFVDGSVVNVALPAIQDDLGGGLALQQWVVDAYLLTLGSLILVGGSLGDLFGGKRIFLIGLGTFGLTSALCALALERRRADLRARTPGASPAALLTPSALATITVRLQRRGTRRRDRHLDGLDRDRVRRRARRGRLARHRRSPGGRSS